MGDTRKKDVNREILNAAASMFRERGFFSVSLNDVASKIDISKGTLYYYFDTRDKLIAKVAELHFEKLLNAMYDWTESIGSGSDPHSSLYELLSFMDRDGDAALHMALMSYSVFCDGPEADFIREEYNKLYVVFDLGMLRLYGAKANSELSLRLFELLDAAFLKLGMSGVIGVRIESLFNIVEDFLAVNYDRN